MLIDEAEILEETRSFVDEDDVLTVTGDAATHKSWPRPHVAILDPAIDKIVFQQIDVDFYKVSHTTLSQRPVLSCR